MPTSTVVASVGGSTGNRVSPSTSQRVPAPGPDCSAAGLASAARSAALARTKHPARVDKLVADDRDDVGTGARVGENPRVGHRAHRDRERRQGGGERQVVVPRERRAAPVELGEVVLGHQPDDGFAVPRGDAGGQGAHEEFQIGRGRRVGRGSGGRARRRAGDRRWGRRRCLSAPRRRVPGRNGAGYRSGVGRILTGGHGPSRDRPRGAGGHDCGDQCERGDPPRVSSPRTRPRSRGHAGGGARGRPVVPHASSLVLVQPAARGWCETLATRHCRRRRRGHGTYTRTGRSCERP